jgi:hypothetical protein
MTRVRIDRCKTGAVMVRTILIVCIRLRGTAFILLVSMMHAEMLRIVLVRLCWPGVDAGRKQRKGGEKGEYEAHR